MRKLFVAGCSFSDYTKVDTVYGEIVAKKLAYDYVHEGAGCGSNWRIWRRITNAVIDGELTPNDLLVVQYTGIERQEFWSRFDQPKHCYGFKGNKDKLPTVEKSHEDGFLLRFKMDSYEWQDTDEDKEFHKMYQENHLSHEFAWEQFRVHSYNFQHMLLVNKIPTVFIRTWRNNTNLYENANTILDEFRPNMFVDVFDRREYKYNLTEYDIGHMSQEGHELFADRLYTHINNIGLNKGSQ